MSRFYLSPHAWNQAQLDETEAHHAKHVLRLQPGDNLTVFDGKGRVASATIEAFHKKNATLRLGASQLIPRPTIEITLAQAVPKGRNIELIIQKAVELGATRIIPLITDRTIVRCQNDEASAKQERWQAIALEACKQCGQNWMPIVEAPCSLQESLKMTTHHDLRLIASLEENSLPLKKIFEQVKRPIFSAYPSRPYHNKEIRPSSELLRSDEEGQCLPEKAPCELNGYFSATIFIGPEGDFTPAEYLLARAAGCESISLGSIVLRTETASFYALSVLANEFSHQ